MYSSFRFQQTLIRVGFLYDNSRTVTSVGEVGSRQIVETSFFRFDVSWLKETSVRGLLAHVLAEIDSNLCLDDADAIHVTVMQHVDEWAGRSTQSC